MNFLSRPRPIIPGNITFSSAVSSGTGNNHGKQSPFSGLATWPGSLTAEESRWPSTPFTDSAVPGRQGCRAKWFCRARSAAKETASPCSMQEKHRAAPNPARTNLERAAQIARDKLRLSLGPAFANSPPPQSRRQTKGRANRSFRTAEFVGAMVRQARVASVGSRGGWSRPVRDPADNARAQWGLRPNQAINYAAIITWSRSESCTFRSLARRKIVVAIDRLVVDVARIIRIVSGAVIP